MKVCIVSTHTPSNDAIGIYTAQLAKELSKRVSVSVLANSTTKENKKLKSNVKTQNGQYIINRVWSEGFFYAFQIFRALIKEKPDIIHVQHEYFLYGKKFQAILFPVVLILIRLTRIPFLITMHHVIPIKESKTFLELFKIPIPRFFFEIFLRIFNITFSLANKIIVPSSDFKIILNHDYRISQNKIEVLPHFITANKSNIEINQLNAKKKLKLEGKNIVLFFGYIRPFKGLEYAIYSLPAVIEKFPNLIFSVVGKAQPKYSDYLKHIHKIINEEKLTNYVRFENYVPEEKLKIFFGAADIILFPYTSMVGTTPIAHMKGAEFGKPIIATNIAYFKQTLTDHENAILIPPKNHQELSKNIIELLSNHKLSKKISTNIKKYGLQFTEEKIVERLIQNYEDIIIQRKCN